MFSIFDGKPFFTNSVTHAWIKLIRGCGIPGRRLHNYRHSYATLLLRQNVHPSIVANQLGHASVKTTLDIYSHSVPGLLEAAAVKVDDVVIGKKPVTNPLQNKKRPLVSFRLWVFLDSFKWWAIRNSSRTII